MREATDTVGTLTAASEDLCKIKYTLYTPLWKAHVKCPPEIIDRTGAIISTNYATILDLGARKMR